MAAMRCRPRTSTWSDRRRAHRKDMSVSALPAAVSRPVPIVPELYSALEAALRVIDSAIVWRDADGKSQALEAAMAIVFDLIASVDLEHGGELAPRLAALYGYFSSELLFIARFDGREQLRALLDMLSVLRGTWDDAGLVVA